MKVVKIPLYLLKIILKTIWIHLFGKGPDVKEWSLGLHIMIKVSKAWFTSFIGVPNPTFRRIHDTIMYSKAIGCKTVYTEVPQKFRKLSHEIINDYSVKKFGVYYFEEGDKWEDSPPLEICHIIPNKLVNSSVKKSLYYLHGGGFVFGHPSCYHYNLGNIAKSAGVQVWALNYRKAPEYCLPAIFEDLIAGYLFLTSKLSDGGLGISSRDIVAGGDSAGGCMSTQLIHFLRDCDALEQISGAVLWSPAIDLSGSQPTFHENIPKDILPDHPLEPIEITSNYSMKTIIDLFCYNSGNDREKEKIIRNGGPLGLHTTVLGPLYNPISNSDYSNLPPILIQVGGSEFLRDDGYIYSKRVFSENLGKKSLNPNLPAQTLQIYEGMPHVFMIIPLAPARRVAVERTANFIKLCLDEKLQDTYQSGITENLSLEINGTDQIPKKNEYRAYRYKYNGEVEVVDPNYPTNIDVTPINFQLSKI